MDKEQIKSKMNSMKEKMKEVNVKLKDAADTAIIVGLESKDVLDEKLSDAKSALAAGQENYRKLSERGKSKLSSELLKAQMNFDETRKAMEEKKQERNKEKMEKNIEDMLEYAELCNALAVVATEEATVAYLEALDLQVEYEKEYGKKEDK